MKFYCLIIAFLFFSTISYSQNKFIYVEVTVKGSPLDPYVNKFYIPLNDTIDEQHFKRIIISDSLLSIVNDLPKRIYITDYYNVAAWDSGSDAKYPLDDLEKLISNYYFISFEYDNIEMKFSYISKEIRGVKMTQMIREPIFFIENNKLDFNTIVNNKHTVLFSY